MFHGRRGAIILSPFPATLAHLSTHSFFLGTWLCLSGLADGEEGIF